jgi:tetratricopeptide (TPR) repeat protein
VDIEVRGVLPHAHYLCRSMKGYADLPDGSRRWLMAIKEWDFNWQGDYQYPAPINLPKGTRVTMEYSYDNSTNNARNPNRPPQPVSYGMQSTDEMAELWLLIVMKSQSDSLTFQRALAPRFLQDTILANEVLLRQNPRDAKAHTEIGSALVMMGKANDGLARLRTAIEINPAYEEAHYFSGLAHRHLKQLDNARREFETTVQLNPRHGRARGNLGLVLAEQGDLLAAKQHFQIALQLNPQDQIARDMLQQIDQALSQGR